MAGQTELPADRLVRATWVLTRGTSTGRSPPTKTARPTNPDQAHGSHTAGSARPKRTVPERRDHRGPPGRPTIREHVHHGWASMRAWPGRSQRCAAGTQVSDTQGCSDIRPFSRHGRQISLRLTAHFAVVVVSASSTAG